MKRALTPGARITFECGHHKVALVAAPRASFSHHLSAGGPVLAPIDEVGTWSIDLEAMTCPSTGASGRDGLYRDGEQTLDWCVIHWHIWIDDSR